MAALWIHFVGATHVEACVQQWKNLTNLFLSLPAKSGNCLDVLGSFKSDF